MRRCWRRGQGRRGWAVCPVRATLHGICGSTVLGGFSCGAGPHPCPFMPATQPLPGVRNLNNPLKTDQPPARPGCHPLPSCRGRSDPGPAAARGAHAAQAPPGGALCCGQRGSRQVEGALLCDYDVIGFVGCYIVNLCCLVWTSIFTRIPQPASACCL
jgi:hypothetical protein